MSEHEFTESTKAFDAVENRFLDGIDTMIEQPVQGAFNPIAAPQLLDEPDAEQPAWVLEEFLPEGGLAALVAKPKVGKTTISYELAVKVAQGLPYLGRTTRRGHVLILALEEHAREVKRRLRDLGADQIDDIHVHIGRLVDSPDNFHKIHQFITDHAIILVIIDTLNSFWSVRDENDAVAVTKALKPILNLARESGAAILLVHHARKADGDFGDEIRGSGALFSLLDVAIVVKRHEVERQRKLSMTSRYPETPSELIIELRDHGHESLGDPTDVGKAAKVAKIQATLTDTPEPAKEISRKAGVSRGPTYTILDRLVARERAGDLAPVDEATHSCIRYSFLILPLGVRAKTKRKAVRPSPNMTPPLPRDSFRSGVLS